MTLPDLYQKSATGAVKLWRIEAVACQDGTAIVRTTHGQVGGQLQVKDRSIATGKNIGKKNETTPIEQAESEARSKWQKKVDSGYTEDPSGDNANLRLPMLAQLYNDAKHRLSPFIFVQPKLNGVRCLARKVSEREIDFLSRLGKSYNGTLGHLRSALLPAMRVGEIFDGEIYHHGLSFQQIVRRVKKLREDGSSAQLQYWVYDLADAEKTQRDRLDILAERLNPRGNGLVRLVHTEPLSAYEGAEILRRHKKWVRHGYEGLIVRDAEGTYQFGHRSHYLQKYKEFMDKEVEIIGGKSGEGVEEGCVVFQVKDEHGNVFWSRPRGSRAVRRDWLLDLPRLVGKMLTIRFQELSEERVPVFNVGISIRDYE